MDLKLQVVDLKAEVGELSLRSGGIPRFNPWIAKLGLDLLYCHWRMLYIFG